MTRLAASILVLTAAGCGTRPDDHRPRATARTPEQEALRADLTDYISKAAYFQAVAAWNSFWHENLDITDRENRRLVDGIREGQLAVSERAYSDVVKRHGMGHQKLKDVDPARAAKVDAFMESAKGMARSVCRNAAAELAIEFGKRKDLVSVPPGLAAEYIRQSLEQVRAGFADLDAEYRRD